MSAEEKKEIPTIECLPNGPLRVKGCRNLKRVQDGKTFPAESAVLCRCGGSKNKPFCDGTHAAIGFKDAKEADRTPDKRDHYVGRKITLHDNRGLCAHAGFCTDSLKPVFRLKQEPWIDPDAAEVDEIIEAVEKCPSGALSYTPSSFKSGEPSS